MRFVASMLAIAIAICFSFSSMGCGNPDKKTTTGKTTGVTGEADKTKFSASATTGTLAKKDDKVEIAFTNGDPKSVDPTDKDGIKAEVKDKKVIFTVKDDLAATEDKTVEFTVKGGKEDKEEAKVKITLKKK